MATELILYTLSFFYGVFILLKWRGNILKRIYYMFFLFNFIFIVLPSYYIFTKEFSYNNMSYYFLSILISQVIISIPVIFSKKVLDFKSGFESKSKYNHFFPNIILLITIFYILYGVYYSGFNTLPIIHSIFNDGSSLVSFRKVFWREGIAQLPLGSLIRFLAKYGMVTLSIMYYLSKDKRRFILYSIVTIIACTLEGTKSGLMIFIIPLMIAVYFQKKKISISVYLLFIALIIGSIAFAATEADGDIVVAFQDKILDRALGAPNKVAMTHFITTGDNYQYGNTMSIIANINGGYSNVLGQGILDYDNYVYREIFYDELGYYPTLGGSANAPFFIYGWDDFGLLGIILVSILGVISLTVVDKIFLRKYAGIFYPIVLLFLVLLVTSQSLYSWFLGVDTIIGLVFLKVLIINPFYIERKDSLVTILTFFAGSVVYVLGFMSRYYIF